MHKRFAWGYTLPPAPTDVPVRRLAGPGAAVDLEREHNELVTAPVGKLLFKFAIPSIVALMVHAAYNIVDRIFVGRLVGPDGLAATSVAFPPLMVQFAFIILICVGQSSIVSIRMGQKDRDGARAVFANGLWMSAVMSVLLAVAAVVFADPVLRLSGAGDSILPMARGYMLVTLIGTACLAASFTLNFHIRAAGHPKTSMMLMLVGSGFNILLDPIFIGPLGMGVTGAAMATVVAEGISAIVSAVWLYRHPEVPSLTRATMRPNPRLCGSMLYLGLGPFFSNIVGSVQFSILNYQVMRFGGEVAVGITGVAFAMSSFVSLPVFGISDGMQPIAGFNHGAGNHDRVRRVVWLSVLWGTVAACAGTLVVEVFPRPIVGLFSSDQQFVDMTVRAIRIVFLTAPILGLQAIGTRYFQSVGRGGVSAFLSLSRQLIFYVPLLLLLPPMMGLDGVWWTAPAADVVSTAVTAVMLVWGLRNVEPRRDQPDMQTPRS